MKNKSSHSPFRQSFERRCRRNTYKSMRKFTTTTHGNDHHHHHYHHTAVDHFHHSSFSKPVSRLICDDESPPCRRWLVTDTLALLPNGHTDTHTHTHTDRDAPKHWATLTTALALRGPIFLSRSSNSQVVNELDKRLTHNHRHRHWLARGPVGSSWLTDWAGEWAELESPPLTQSRYIRYWQRDKTEPEIKNHCETLFFLFLVEAD